MCPLANTVVTERLEVVRADARHAGPGCGAGPFGVARYPGGRSLLAWASARRTPSASRSVAKTGVPGCCCQD